ncbi:hypothetical protein [Fluviicola chungangensis]|uniref:Outer membrane beta-barrel protein n=1 Tax=Fluviicola chungangensis TaxID=2597671 RepID=A0A556MND1_9FLAO|nr:hypothetical protein [Fluviicola chungangensis]TSJ41318.1 hypothetical protein FO442_15515 [Fluviicola chungangensis]
MKYCVITFFALFTASANAQEKPVKRNEYKAIGITYSSYAKPQSSSLYQTNLLQNPNTYDDVRRNIGVTFSYTQMNFIKNFGVEFGIGLELMMTDNSFRFTLPPLSDPTEMNLNDSRSNAGFVHIPLHYVHRIELKNRFTLFPKIGVDAKVLIINPEYGTGIYTDSLNNINYSLGYETTQLYSNGPFQNVFLNGMIGANLTWSTQKGATFGLQLAFSVQIIPNTLLTRIRDIQYKKDGEVVFDSNKFNGDYYYYDQNGQLVYQPPTKTSDFLAENKMTNFSIGVSYVFGK